MSLARLEAADSTRSETAYRLVRQDVLSGALRGGERMKIEELQRRYSLSSSPLREALSRLTVEGLVVADQRRGFRVAEVSINDLEDLTAFRLLVEPDSFRQAIRHGDDDWEAGIVSAFHRLERFHVREAQEAPATDEWTARHRAFHMALIDRCPSLRQQAVCASLFDQAERYRRLSISLRKTRRDSMGEHRELMDAALRRDADQACALLHEHIARTTTHVADNLRRSAQVGRP